MEVLDARAVVDVRDARVQLAQRRIHGAECGANVRLRTRRAVDRVCVRERIARRADRARRRVVGRAAAKCSGRRRAFLIDLAVFRLQLAHVHRVGAVQARCDVRNPTFRTRCAHGHFAACARRCRQRTASGVVTCRRERRRTCDRIRAQCHRVRLRRAGTIADRDSVVARCGRERAERRTVGRHRTGRSSYRELVINACCIERLGAIADSGRCPSARRRQASQGDVLSVGRIGFVADRNGVTGKEAGSRCQCIRADGDRSVVT